MSRNENLRKIAKKHGFLLTAEDRMAARNWLDKQGENLTGMDNSQIMKLFREKILEPTTGSHLDDFKFATASGETNEGENLEIPNFLLQSPGEDTPKKVTNESWVPPIFDDDQKPPPQPSFASEERPDFDDTVTGDWREKLNNKPRFQLLGKATWILICILAVIAIGYYGLYQPNDAETKPQAAINSLEIKLIGRDTIRVKVGDELPVDQGAAILKNGIAIDTVYTPARILSNSAGAYQARYYMIPGRYLQSLRGSKPMHTTRTYIVNPTNINNQLRESRGRKNRSMESLRKALRESREDKNAAMQRLRAAHR